MIILQIWLAGWIISGTYFGAKCTDQDRHMTKNECRIFNAVISAGWPIFLPSHIKEKIEESEDESTR